MTKIASDAVATTPGAEGNLSSRAQASNGPVRPSLVIPSNATILMAVHVKTPVVTESVLVSFANSPCLGFRSTVAGRTNTS